MNPRHRLAAALLVGFLASSRAIAAAPATQPYDWKSVTIKANGFIDGVVFSPVAGGPLFIHTDMGGAYRLDASRWTPLNDWSRWNDPAAHNLGTETLAVDPSDPDRVYVGIGTYMQPSAILRSSDRGKTWQRTDVPFAMNGNGSGRNTGERLRVDPNAPDVLLYATRDKGLWRSGDRGATWSNVASFPTVGHDAGWGENTGLLFVEFDKSSGKAGAATPTIYVGAFEPADGKPRIYRSADAGATWTPLPGGQPMLADEFPQRAALTPDGETLFLTYAKSTVYPGPYGLDGGAVWRVDRPSSATPTWRKISPPVRYAFCALALDPTDPKTVYVGEMGDYDPADCIWRSRDAGETWTKITPNAHRDDASAPYATSLKVHWLGDLQIDPHDRDVALFTTGYGLYRTANLTADEPTWTFFNDGFEQSAALELASPNGGPVHLFSAIGDRDGYRHADFDASPADGLFGQNNGLNRGTCDDVDVAWEAPDVLVRVVRQPPFVQASDDNGVTWSWLSEQNARGGNGGSLAIGNDGNRVVYAPADKVGGLLVSTRDGGKWSAWQTAGGDVPKNGGTRVVVDLARGNVFYAITGRVVRRSEDNGQTWSIASEAAAPPDVNWVRSIPGHAGHLVASTSHDGVASTGAWRSTDGGVTWTRLAPDNVAAALAVGVGAAAPGADYPALFVNGSANGTTGYFRSDDEGKTWTTISDAEHQFGGITVIQGDPRVFGRLYVGTNGRGILVGDLATGATR